MSGFAHLSMPGLPKRTPGPRPATLKNLLAKKAIEIERRDGEFEYYRLTGPDARTQ
jgi:hypothetical protein